MLQRLRKPEPFGKAGLTVAILALVLAMVGGAWAAGGLTANQKKEVTKIAKKFAGAAGPEGKQGLPGANGANGTNGRDGATGQTGQPGPLVETLPSGKSETGAWNYFDPGAGVEIVTMSYPIRLAAPISTADIVLLKPEEGETADCPGTLEEPKAASGKLCIYQKELEPGVEVKTEPHFGIYPVSITTGVALFFEGPGGYGSWAVTAP